MLTKEQFEQMITPLREKYQEIIFHNKTLLGCNPIYAWILKKTNLEHFGVYQ